MGNAYPEAAGFRNIGDTSMGYIPELWSTKLLVKFYDATVIAAISNVDYEGEIKEQGDTVNIRSVPTITIRNHRKGQVLKHEQPISTPVTLLIDKGKYWAFTTSKVDDVQTDINGYADTWTDDASEQLKITIDTDILADIASDAHASNQGSSAGAKSGTINLGVANAPFGLTKANVNEKIVDLGTVLDEQSVPESGRYLVMAPWACALIKKSDLKDASLAGDPTSILRNGIVGMIDRFTIYNSNLVNTTADGGGQTAYDFLFGTTHALTFASQLVENEMKDNPYGFGYLFQGLQVFGYKVVKPEALGWLYAYAA